MRFLLVTVELLSEPVSGKYALDTLKVSNRGLGILQQENRSSLIAWYFLVASCYNQMKVIVLLIAAVVSVVVVAVIAVVVILFTLYIVILTLIIIGHEAC